MNYTPQTALIIIDTQNDFADPHGTLPVNGALNIIPEINRQIAEAEKAGATIIYTRDWHPKTTPHFAKDGGPWPTHCVKNTWGAMYHPDLTQPDDNHHEILKGTGTEHGYSAFDTELNDYLQANKTALVVIAGLATDYCVKATALDSKRLGYETVVLTDAIASVNISLNDGPTAIKEMLNNGIEFA